MAFSKSAVPASLRKRAETLRTSTQRGVKSPATFGVPADTKTQSGVKVELASLKARFMRIPQEPEDAKLTGDTRSLDRRVLGLNLGGSLSRRVPGFPA